MICLALILDEDPQVTEGSEWRPASASASGSPHSQNQVALIQINFNSSDSYYVLYSSSTESPLIFGTLTANGEYYNQ